MESAMWVELGKFIVEFVKATAWPIVVLIVALSFKPGLLGALPSLFRRRLEVEALGLFTAKIDAEQQQAVTENPATEKLPEAAALAPSPRPAVNIIEARLRESVKGIETGKKEPTLVRALAETRLVAGHEYTYNRTFGSQIAWLKRLNEVGRATVDNAREFFKPYAEKFPQVYSNYGFDGWLGFLKASELIAQNGDVLVISAFGQDFLIYLTERRLTENRPW
jgi:hypothetical protein